MVTITVKHSRPLGLASAATEIGEATTTVNAPAIANAIFAQDWRDDSFGPFTADKVLAELRRSGKDA